MTRLQAKTRWSLFALIIVVIMSAAIALLRLQPDRKELARGREDDGANRNASATDPLTRLQEQFGTTIDIETSEASRTGASSLLVRFQSPDGVPLDCAKLRISCAVLSDSGPKGISAEMAADGKWCSWKNLPQGKYRVKVRPKTHGRKGYAGQAVIEVPQSSEVQGRMVVSPVPPLRGLLVDSAGSPLGGVEIRLDSAPRIPEGARYGYNAYHAITQDDGTFSFEGLNPWYVYRLRAVSDEYEDAVMDVDTVELDGPIRWTAEWTQPKRVGSVHVTVKYGENCNPATMKKPFSLIMQSERGGTNIAVVEGDDVTFKQVVRGCTYTLRCPPDADLYIARGKQCAVPRTGAHGYEHEILVKKK